jgi:murein DD-endopeptidase MepM/ murein hydrolase activator NlpD
MGCVMFADKPLFRVRLGLRLLVATAAAALLTGCSDATRLSSNPFSNPFETASSGPVDRAPTGTIAPRAPSSSSMKIESKPLAPPSGASSLPAPVTTPQAPAPQAAAASRTSAASLDHWSAEGGTPIVVAQGETVRTLSDRYGVPQDALLRANGFNTAAQVQPGARLVVPVFRATATRTATAAPAPVARFEASKPEPKKAEAKKAEAKAEAPKEKFRLVKGPEPAAKAAKTAKVEKDDDEDEVAEKKAPEKKVLDKKKAVDKKADAKAKAARKDDDDEDEKPAVKQTPAIKPQREKQAAAEPAPQPEPKKEVRKIEMKQAEAKKPEVDRTETTASLPKEEPKATSGEANPEFRWPARGRVIQGFKSGGNDGINIAVPEGTAVKAAEGGVVKYAGSELKGYGNLVLIQHPNGFVSAYAHNGELDVKRGDTVKRGQTIAKAGQTGNVSSPQVHFELRKGSTPVDPTGYLAGL